MAKTLKLATIEKRFEKLHNVTNFAEDYAKAIAEHAQLLFHEDQTSAQTDVTMNMVEQIDDWIEKFAPLASEMQRVESLYYATANGDTAELVEEIPSTAKWPTVEPYKMTEELCKIGYIEIEGDPYLTANKQYSDEEIIENVKNMLTNLTLCIKALAFASYKGVWKDVEKKAVDIHDTFPYEAIVIAIKAYRKETHN